MNSALIVIDMQLGSFTPRSARHDTQAVVAHINALAERARAVGDLVVFVQHDGPLGDPHHPEEPGWHLLPELKTAPQDQFVRKTSCDAFLGSGLSDLLRASQVEQLVVTGCATDYCVDTTVRSALARGYRTVVPCDAHTTADRPHLTAEQIIEHHNAVWSDFISPVGPATVCRSSEVAFSQEPQSAPSSPMPHAQ